MQEDQQRLLSQDYLGSYNSNATTGYLTFPGRHRYLGIIQEENDWKCSTEGNNINLPKPTIKTSIISDWTGKIF